MNAQRAGKEPRLALDDFENMLFDRPEDEKWELIDGRLLKSMVGARWEHKQIVLNLTLALNTHFRSNNSPCRAYDESFWVRSEAHDVHAFPDVVVFCGRLETDQKAIDNPIVLIEVVSPSSQQRDLVIKRYAYRRLPSLASYVVVFRDHMRVEHDVRMPQGWRGEAALETPSAVEAFGAPVRDDPCRDLPRRDRDRRGVTCRRGPSHSRHEAFSVWPRS